MELLNKSTNSDEPTIHTNTLNQEKKQCIKKKIFNFKPFKIFFLKKKETTKKEEFDHF